MTILKTVGNINIYLYDQYVPDHRVGSCVMAVSAMLAVTALLLIIANLPKFAAFTLFLSAMVACCTILAMTSKAPGYVVWYPGHEIYIIKKSEYEDILSIKNAVITLEQEAMKTLRINRMVR